MSGKRNKNSMNIKDKRVKAIYHYLTESCTNSDIEELITLLKDYVINGSFIDFEEYFREESKKVC